MLLLKEWMEHGKTTVAKSIEKDFNFKYVKDPLKEVLEINEKHLRKISNKIFEGYDDRLKAWYLLFGDIYALKHYRNENIVMDRHILLNYFWNGNEESEEIFSTRNKFIWKTRFNNSFICKSRNKNEKNIKKKS